MIAPVRLDPFRNIVNVGWATGHIAVLTFQFSMQSASFPDFTLIDLPIGSSFRIFFDTAKIPDSGVSIVNPISKEMLKALAIWSAVPEQLGPRSDGVNQGKALIFFNLSKVIAEARKNNPLSTSVVLGRLTTPTGGVETISATFYWLWDDTFGATSLEENQAFPFTTGDPIHGGVMTVPRAFDNSGDRDAYLTLGVTAWHGAATTETNDANNNLIWSTELNSWNHKFNFPVEGESQTATLTPAGYTASGDETLNDSASDFANQGGAPSLASVTLQYTLVFEGHKVRIERV